MLIFYISVQVHHIWKQEVPIRSNTHKRYKVVMSAALRLQVQQTAVPFTFHLEVRWKWDGFGGLVVSILASGTRVPGFKTGRSPNFGGEVKESVPYPSFAACKRA